MKPLLERMKPTSVFQSVTGPISLFWGERNRKLLLARLKRLCQRGCCSLMRAAQHFLRRRQAKDRRGWRFLLCCWLNTTTLRNAANWGKGSILVWRRLNLHKHRKPINESSFPGKQWHPAISLKHPEITGKKQHKAANPKDKPNKSLLCCSALWVSLSQCSIQPKTKGTNKIHSGHQSIRTRLSNFPEKLPHHF